MKMIIKSIGCECEAKCSVLLLHSHTVAYNSHLFNVIIIILAVLSRPESLKKAKTRFIDLFTGFSMLIAFLSRSVYIFSAHFVVVVVVRDGCDCLKNCN